MYNINRDTIYLAYEPDTLEFKGFYMEGIHDSIPSPNICIDSALRREIQKFTQNIYLTKDFPQKELYTIEDITIFTEKPLKKKPYKPTRVDALEEQNADLILNSASRDSHMEELNVQNANALLDSAMKDTEIENLNQTVSELLMTVAQLQGGK